MDKLFFICLCGIEVQLHSSLETECENCKRRYWKLIDEKKGKMAILIWEESDNGTDEEVTIKTFTKNND